MSEFTATFLKIISSIASPKAAIKAICSAVGLFCSYILIPKTIFPSDMPNDFINTSLLFLGIGVGVLAGHLIGNLTDSMSEKKRAKKNKEIADKNKQRDEQALVDHFTLTYPHLHYEDKRFLISLLKHNSVKTPTISMGRLLSQKYIIQVSKIDLNQALYALNPILRDTLISIK